MSLLFNMLYRLVITFLPRSKHLSISWLQSPSAVILEPPKRKSATVSPSICHVVMGPDAMILVFWMLSFQPTFWLSSFTFIKRLFSSSSLSAIKVVLSAYLRLLIFLLAILIPAYASSSPVFLMMYSAYKLNKQGDNIQPWRTPFPLIICILNKNPKWVFWHSEVWSCIPASDLPLISFVTTNKKLNYLLFSVRFFTGCLYEEVYNHCLLDPSNHLVTFSRTTLTGW